MRGTTTLLVLATIASLCLLSIASDTSGQAKSQQLRQLVLESSDGIVNLNGTG